VPPVEESFDTYSRRVSRNTLDVLAVCIFVIHAQTRVPICICDTHILYIEITLDVWAACIKYVGITYMTRIHAY